jgi:O-glycosyl hydrolase
MRSSSADLIAGALCVLLLWGTASLACAQATVSVNQAVQYQTILGWGATASRLDYPLAARERILDVAVNEVGLTRLRFEGSRRQWEDVRNDDGDPYHVTAAAFDATDIDQRVEEVILPFKKRVEARGDPFCMYLSPSFFDGGSSGSAPAWMLGSPAEYAEWALAFIEHLKSKYGLEPDFYSVCNEAGNNNAFGPQIVADIIRELGPRMAQAGLKTRIEFPECVNAGASWRYIQSTQNDPELWKYVGVLSYHLYGDRTPRPQIRDFAAARGIPTAQTEFMGTTINDLYEDLTEGGVSYWEHYGMAGSWGGNGTYLQTSLDGNAISFYGQTWNFRQVMHYVRPGAARIGANSDNPDVRALAFLRDSQVTVVLLRTTPPWEPRDVTITGLPAGRYGVSVASAGTPARELGAQVVDDSGRLSVTVPSGGVMTVYPCGGGNLPPSVTEARAAPAFLTAPAAQVRLSAVATDPEAAAVQLQWKTISAPEGAAPRIASPDAPSTLVTGLAVPGDYVFAVTASDGELSVEREVRVAVYATNLPPRVVDLHNRLPVTLTLPNTACTICSAALDPEGDKCTFRWSLLTQPEGADAKIADPAANRTKVSDLTVAGEYVFQVDVSDGAHTEKGEVRVRVWPAAKQPVVSNLSATPPALMPPAAETTLTVEASDPDGEPVTVWWRVKRAPQGAGPVFERAGARQTRVSGLNQPGQYTFQVTAINRAASTVREITVPVGAAAIQAGTQPAVAIGPPQPAGGVAIGPPQGGGGQAPAMRTLPPGVQGVPYTLGLAGIDVLPAMVDADPPDPILKGVDSIITARGTTLGTVVGKGRGWIDVQSGTGKVTRYIPQWVGGNPNQGGGPEQRVVNQINSAPIGSSVLMSWYVTDHIRIANIEPRP